MPSIAGVISTLFIIQETRLLALLTSDNFFNMKLILPSLRAYLIQSQTQIIKNPRERMIPLCIVTWTTSDD